MDRYIHRVSEIDRHKHEDGQKKRKFKEKTDRKKDKAMQE
jgi:hypothetical protein